MTGHGEPKTWERALVVTGAESEPPRPPPLDSYYWLPTPEHATLAWDVVTCHQLGFDSEVGHVEMWTAVIDSPSPGTGDSGPAAAAQGSPLRLAKGSSNPTGQTLPDPPR
jgi:hypothetical protein